LIGCRGIWDTASKGRKIRSLNQDSHALLTDPRVFDEACLTWMGEALSEAARLTEVARSRLGKSARTKGPPGRGEPKTSR
jgi:hypothetical protein